MRGSGSAWRRAATTPALHFLLLGAALLAGDRWLRMGPAVAPEAVSRTITISRAEREQLRADWAQQWGRPPSEAEERALVRQAVDDEVLLREAIARGLDRDDRVVRTRLAQLAEFVGAEGDTNDLVTEARRLGLDQSDLVVRRYLVQTMRLVASRPTPDDAPTEAEVRAWYEAHRERFRQPPRVGLVHVYFSRDRRGASLAEDAARALARLRREGLEPGAAARLGDPFIRGAEMPSSTPEELARAFGPGFAEAVGAAPEGEWSGPFESAYGLHLVWVRARQPSAVPPLAAVRNRVVHGLLQERREARLARRLREWRRRYVVVVEGDGA